MRPVSISIVIFRVMVMAPFCLAPWISHAHIGQKNIIQQAVIGEYPARITIKKPDVIPGIARIFIRFQDNPELESVTVLPIQSDLGKKGSPPPDPALPVKGEPGLYEGELWIMTSMPHSITVTAKGPLGEGTAFVPFTPMATNTPSMNGLMTIILIALMAVLIFLLLSIIRQSVLYSTLEPGINPDKPRIIRANTATIVGLLVIGLILFGGKKWWDEEEKNYTDNRLYSPAELTADVYDIRELTGDASSRHMMRLEFPEESFRRKGPLVPDHGKLVHVFVVPVDESAGSVAHLHPIKFLRNTFWTTLPDLPAGNFHLFADVTHETGYAQTFVGKLDTNSQSRTADDLGEIESRWLSDIQGVSDPDDSWVSLAQSQELEIDNNLFTFDDGISVRWLGGQSTDPSDQLEFEIIDESGQPVQPDPYLGMRAHATVVGKQGTIYTHLHPVGSISMAAMQLFELRDSGKIPSQIGQFEPVCQLPSVDESLDQWLKMSASKRPGHVVFPYIPPESGSYRVWIQFKLGRKIYTAFMPMNLRDS